MNSGKTLRGVILAAGFGKRMAALTRTVPKPLLPIVNRPAIERILLALRDAGVCETLIVAGYRAEAIEAFCGDGSQWDMPIRYAQQTEVSGTGSAAKLARAFAGEQPFVLTYGDILLEPGEYQGVVDLFFETGSAASSALNRMDDVSKGSAVFLNGHRITGMIEKPPPGSVSSNLNNAGVYVFQPAIFDAIDRTPKSARGEYELTEAVQALVADQRLVTGHVIAGVQYDIGTPESFLDANERLIDVFSDAASPHDPPAPMTDNFASPNLVLQPPVAIDPTAQIERCRLGPGVCVGQHVRIGHGAAIEHSVILPGADIGDGVSMAYAIVGFDVSVPNRQIVHGDPSSVVVVSADEP